MRCPPCACRMQSIVVGACQCTARRIAAVPRDDTSRLTAPLSTCCTGWKSRNDLVLGHVKAIKRVNVEVMPMNPEKKGKTVVRHPDKLMHESDIAKEDLEEAQRQGGHSAC